MPATIAEKFDSRPATVGKDSTADLLYVVQGTEDDAEVHVAVTANVGLWALVGVGFLGAGCAPPLSELVAVHVGRRILAEEAAWSEALPFRLTGYDDVLANGKETPMRVTLEGACRDAPQLLRHTAANVMRCFLLGRRVP